MLDQEKYWKQQNILFQKERVDVKENWLNNVNSAASSEHELTSSLPRAARRKGTQTKCTNKPKTKLPIWQWLLFLAVRFCFFFETKMHFIFPWN